MGAPTGPANQQPPPIFSAPNSRELEPYENTLKDFNSAFRSTPYSSPAHPGSDLDSGISDEDRGINWSRSSASPVKVNWIHSITILLPPKHGPTQPILQPPCPP